MDQIGTWLSSNSALLIMVAIFGGIPLVGLISYFSARRQHFSHKQNLPTLAEYIMQHPGCKTDHGMRCFHCNSNSIRNLGLNNSADPRRVFVCNHCNSWLYRNAEWK